MKYKKYKQEIQTGKEAEDVLKGQSSFVLYKFIVDL